MPVPSDLPSDLGTFVLKREAAKRKYEPLVRNLATMEFIGLMEAVTAELARRNIDWERPSQDPGSRIGR